MNGNFPSASGDYGRLERAYGSHHVGQSGPSLLIDVAQ